MRKREYIEPRVEVVRIATHSQLLIGSITDVVTTGLDDDNLLPPNISGSIWEYSM